MYWMRIEKNLTDVSVGAGDAIWGISLSEDTDTPPKVVQRVKDYNEDSELEYVFKDMPDLPNSKTPYRIACAADGTVICLSTDYNIYRYNAFDSSWIQIPDFALTDVDAGSNGLIYGIGTDKNIYYYAGEGTFVKLTVTNNCEAIAIGDDGLILMIDTDGTLNRIYFENNETKFTVLSTTTKFRSISVGSSQKVMGISTDNEVLSYIGEGNFYTESKRQFYYHTVDEVWAWTTLGGNLQRMDHDSNGNCYAIIEFTAGSAYGTFIGIHGEPVIPSTNPVIPTEETAVTA